MFVLLQISFQVVSHCLGKYYVEGLVFFFPDVNNIFIFVCRPLEL